MSLTEGHTVITREEITGVEFDWFAADAAGHIGQFMAAGDPHVPASALASEELLEALHVWIDTRPEREEANALAGGFDEHLTPPQRRGAYVYDHVPGEPGVYRLVAAPRQPLHVSELPEHLQTYLAGLTLPLSLGTPRLWIDEEGGAEERLEEG
ncbi:hypothetical protein L1280_001878 [Deinococcus sp. HSC-46F16]|uniref:hypothetical protein n=1 Tax=Deinococcus sp. HSC-46F16 TaxID=2910968 RepID=UPI0020A0C965|nr:hypothetical protein [Deinococcus sp. HSC-46F16]MCP2014726.1 hypothetical protein [Deinococcus sp. HSC-46F16]